jgi:hypothetical protein
VPAAGHGTLAFESGVGTVTLMVGGELGMGAGPVIGPGGQVWGGGWTGRLGPDDSGRP